MLPVLAAAITTGEETPTSSTFRETIVERQSGAPGGNLGPEVHPAASV